MLPLDNTYVDYADRLDEALRRICDVNNWDAEQLAMNVLQARSDLLLIRADQATFNDSIPLKQAQKILSGSIDMLLAAARSTLTPKAHFRGNYPDLAKEFMDQDVRTGHTRRGSFVLTIVTSLTDRPSSTPSGADAPVEITNPVTPPMISNVSDTIDPQERNEEIAAREGEVPEVDHIPPFPRRVITTLARGLAATRDLAAHTPEISLEEAVSKGVSSNLLDSLSEMSSFEGVGLEYSM
jgi:hypothetical protein